MPALISPGLTAGVLRATPINPHKHPTSVYSVVELLTPAEVAARLKVSRSTVLRLTRAGELTAVQFGRIIRYTPETIDAFIQRHQAGVAASAKPRLLKTTRGQRAA